MMKMKNNQAGYSLIEIMVAVAISFMVVMALGRVITMNTQAWIYNQESSHVQRNASQALDWMSRDIRQARTLEMISATEFRTLGASGAVEHVYRLDTSGSVDRVKRDGDDMFPEACTQFLVTANPDTSGVTVTLTLLNAGGTSVTAMSQAVVRNTTRWF
jgi:type II secretory pathway pseudopilin PulG